MADKIVRVLLHQEHGDVVGRGVPGDLRDAIQRHAHQQAAAVGFAVAQRANIDKIGVVALRHVEGRAPEGVCFLAGLLQQRGQGRHIRLQVDVTAKQGAVGIAAVDVHAEAFLVHQDKKRCLFHRRQGSVKITEQQVRLVELQFAALPGQPRVFRGFGNGVELHDESRFRGVHADVDQGSAELANHLGRGQRLDDQDAGSRHQDEGADHRGECRGDEEFSALCQGAGPRSFRKGRMKDI